MGCSSFRFAGRARIASSRGVAVGIAATFFAVSGVTADAFAVDNENDASYVLEILDLASGAGKSFSNSISDEGLIVGKSREGGVPARETPGVWDPSNAWNALPSEGITDAQAVAISANSQWIVGEEEGSFPLLWESTGMGTWASPLRLPALQTVASIRDVNDDGIAVGFSSGEDYEYAAVRWVDGTIERLPRPSSVHGEVRNPMATAISNGAMITGFAEVEHDDHDLRDRGVTSRHVEPVIQAMVWNGDTGYGLDSPGGLDSDSYAWNISPDGALVVGTAVDLDLSSEYPAIWDIASGTGSFLPLPGGFNSGVAHAVNDAENAVGFSALRGTSEQVATLWKAGASGAHEACNLNEVVEVPPNVTLTDATDISKTGEIAGMASTPDGDRAFRLSPTSLPTIPITTDLPETSTWDYGKPGELSFTTPSIKGLTIEWYRIHTDIPTPITGQASSSLAIAPGDASYHNTQVWARLTAPGYEATETTHTQVTLTPGETSIESTKIEWESRSLSMRIRLNTPQNLIEESEIQVEIANHIVLTSTNLNKEMTLTIPESSLPQTNSFPVTINYQGSAFTAPTTTTTEVTRTGIGPTPPGGTPSSKPTPSAGSGLSTKPTTEHLAQTGSHALTLTITLAASTLLAGGFFLRRHNKTSNTKE